MFGGKLTSNLLKTSRIFQKNMQRHMCFVKDDVLFQDLDGKGVITLNRPKVLNSLNLSMVKKILPTLEEWERNKKLVIIKGAGEKAFCAGGDVKAIVEANICGDKLGEEFFRWEYTMNGMIGNYNPTYIALIDGITMGGGVGLSVHGKYRIATEKTLFAMPETLIGLFPDVGGSYFLPRLQGKLGLYLALTGYRLKGIDNLAAGIATHFVPSNKIPELEHELLNNCSSEIDIKNILDVFNTKESYELSLKDNMEKINHCFGAKTMEEILERLCDDRSPWAQKTVSTLKKMSPTSCKVTKALLDKTSSENLTLEQCLSLEYRVACHTLKGNEFNEGIIIIGLSRQKIYCFCFRREGFVDRQGSKSKMGTEDVRMCYR